MNNTQNDTFLNNPNEVPNNFYSHLFTNDHSNLNRSAASYISPQQNASKNLLRHTQSHLNRPGTNLNQSKNSTKSATKFSNNHKNGFQFGGKPKDTNWHRK